MAIKYYVLVNRKPVETDVVTWARMFEKPAERIVAQTQVGPLLVSTVFLGLNHNFCESGPPLLFETMIFAGHDKKWSEYQSRCATWEQAEEMHLAGVEVAMRTLGWEAALGRLLVRVFRWPGRKFDRIVRWVVGTKRGTPR